MKSSDLYLLMGAILMAPHTNQNIAYGASFVFFLSFLYYGYKGD